MAIATAGIRDEEQLLPDFFGAPARDGIDQRVQDSIPSLVVYNLDPLVLVQLRDHVNRSGSGLGSCGQEPGSGFGLFVCLAN